MNALDGFAPAGDVRFVDRHGLQSGPREDLARFAVVLACFAIELLYIAAHDFANHALIVRAAEQDEQEPADHLESSRASSQASILVNARSFSSSLNISW